MWIDGDEGPDEGAEDEEDVDWGEEVVFEAELKIGKRKIKDEVQGEWQSDQPWDLLSERLVKHRAVSDRDNRV